MNVAYDDILEKVKEELKSKPRFTKSDIVKIELEFYK